MKKLILFDIDGTLLLTGGAGKLAFNQVFLELFGIDEAWTDINPDGRTDPDLIKELFLKNLNRSPKNGEYEQVVQAYQDAMANTLTQAQRFRLMPGIEDLLEILRERDMAHMGLATGNFENTAYQKLHRAGLRNFFSFGGFGSDSRDRLKLTRQAVQRGRQSVGQWVDPEDILLIGDTVHDIRCGKQLGLTTIAVATGSTSMKTLATHRPDFFLEKLEPLEEVLMLFE